MSARDVNSLQSFNPYLYTQSKEASSVSRNDQAFDAASTRVLYLKKPRKTGNRARSSQGLVKKKPTPANSVEIQRRKRGAEILLHRDGNVKKMKTLDNLLRQHNLVDVASVMDFPFHNNGQLLQELLACVDASQVHVVRNALSKELATKD